ncbi:armadillo-type protein [Polychytrium aggregatum]|uniref:armadillo-type protein n=1 Tax=Polychytrium aggregatum TaxID=110093 RepID=UPI0022FDCA80|nr:armadillo-type protein [Polychytrium aggregatum]KAI9203366.1 armadillo-type protein [Polychytrium aggregatum]
MISPHHQSTHCDTSNFGVTDVRTLILLLASPEPAVCLSSIEALTKYAEAASKHRLQLLSLSVLKPFLELSASKDISIRKAAVAAIAATTELSPTDFHPEMRQPHLLKTLIALLSTEEPPEIQDEAAFSIANLARDFANKSDIRRYGGIKALVKLLEVADPDAKKNAGYALSALLDDFSNRTEVRYVGGLIPLLELLGSEFKEIQENALNALIKCAEDYASRTEIRRVNGVKRLIDLTAQDLPDLHYLMLHCLANCLKENETANVFAELGGLQPLTKFLSVEDIRARKNASIAICEAAKIERNQNYLREMGALSALVSNLGHADPGVVSHAAMAIAALAQTEINQIELNKLGVVEIMIKNMAGEDADVVRQSVAALSSLCLSAKIRSRVKSLDGLSPVVKLLGYEDSQTVANAAECISNLSEDTTNRAEIVKLGASLALVSDLTRDDPKIQTAAALALARCLQEAEGRLAVSKDITIARLVELLKSREINVCRNVAYAIANAAQYEPNAVIACQLGGIEALLALSRDATKNAVKFASDALEKLLNHQLSAKYWLKNELTRDNIIRDGFFDMGSAGPNLDAIATFPSIMDLTAQAVDKRREVILVDATQDPAFESLIQEARREGVLEKLNRRGRIEYIARIVSNAMGGPIDVDRLSEAPYKFKITQTKLKLGTNVLPIGSISQGIFYHRALLFKALCDRIGLGPCTLVRGHYNRGWNVVDMKALSLRQLVTVPKNTGARSVTSAGSQRSDARQSSAGSQRGGGLVTASRSHSTADTTPVLTVHLEEDSEIDHAIVDLMHHPGRLLPLGSPDADEYQRMS